MLSRIAFPPFALQAAMFPLGMAILWLSQGDSTADKANAEFALFCFAVGLVGFILFIPLHWVVLALASKLRFPASGLHFVFAGIGAMLYLVPSNLAYVLSLLMMPTFSFLALMTWAAEAWIRRQETREQQATDAFVLARKEMLKQPTKS